jgi:hypothetical protein
MGGESGRSAPRPRRHPPGSECVAEEDRSLRGGESSCDCEKKRRLPGAIGAEDPQDLSGLDHEADFFEDRGLVAAYGQAANRDGERSVRRPLGSDRGRSSRRRRAKKSGGPEEQQTDQDESVREGVRLRKGRPQDQLVERVEGERPEDPAQRVESPPSIPSTSGTTENVGEKTTVVSTLPTRCA